MWRHKCDASTKKAVSNSLDISFIHGRSYKEMECDPNIKLHDGFDCQLCNGWRSICACQIIIHHKKGNFYTMWEWLNDEKQFFLFNLNHIDQDLYLEKNFNYLKLIYTDPCNFLNKRTLGSYFIMMLVKF